MNRIVYMQVVCIFDFLPQFCIHYELTRNEWYTQMYNDETKCISSTPNQFNFMLFVTYTRFLWKETPSMNISRIYNVRIYLRNEWKRWSWIFKPFHGGSFELYNFKIDVVVEIKSKNPKKSWRSFCTLNRSNV